MNIMNLLNQNTSIVFPFSTKGLTPIFGATTITTTLWGC